MTNMASLTIKRLTGIALAVVQTSFIVGGRGTRGARKES
jgi:hypothetical protein